MRAYERTAHIRSAMRKLHYGIYVLTCGAGDQARAATVTWVTQISLQPRRIAVAIRRNGHMVAALRAADAFALNMAAEGDRELAGAFFKHVEPADGALAGYPFEAGPLTGAPLLLDAIAWLECRIVEEANQGGDHSLFLADVLAGDVRKADAPAMSLASTGWSYGG